MVDKKLSRMGELIAALQILDRYDGHRGDFDFQHDEGFFSGPAPKDMTEADHTALKRYGFRWAGDIESWCKFS